MDANQAWIGVLRQIPAELQDVLALGITTGSEIVVQKIVKLEQEFMIIRGRLAGTQDAGRIIIIPYIQLTFIGIQRDLKENQIEAIFGKGGAAGSATVLPAAEDNKAAEPEEEAEEPATPTKRPEAVSKTVLLAKLRGRLKEGGK